MIVTLQKWKRLDTHSWIYPVTIELPGVSTHCINCLATHTVYHNCTLNVEIIHYIKQQSHEHINEKDDAQTDGNRQKVVFQGDNK
jgi:hypothetical protein